MPALDLLLKRVTIFACALLTDTAAALMAITAVHVLRVLSTLPRASQHILKPLAIP
jgi:hypothetical protein